MKEIVEKEKSDKKDHILDVAEKIFAELGYDGASTRAISGEAGVNMAMLNYYFGSKEGLFLAIFERRISSFQTLLQHIGNDERISAWDKLELSIDKYVDRIVVNSCFQRLISREISMNKRWELTRKLTTMLMINIMEFKKIFDEGIRTGMFRADIDPELITMSIFGTKNYIFSTPHLSSLILGNNINDDKYLESELRPRMKTYLKKLLKAYLLKKNDNN